MTYEVGFLIDDRYKVQGSLGQGGHGVVYQCEDQQLGAQVAIKCLHPEVASEPGFKTRMLREARAMGTLSGTSAVQIFAFNKASDGTMYIVMELLKGRDLEKYLRELEGHGGTLAPAKLLDLLGPIVDTLEQAHAQELIHRDLKPGNIFVLDSFARGGVRLLDFGLAKDMKADPLTQEGMITGSPSYIAPEVWRGKPQEIDHRIDVYSLGAVVFRALAGKPPFDPKQTIDRLLIAATRGARPSLHAIRPDLPPAIDGWVQKALAIKRDERFPTVRKLWTALRAVTSAGGPQSGDIDVEIDVD
jgi:eukaryotic-like serine/threonine-protein kinase